MHSPYWPSFEQYGLQKKPSLRKFEGINIPGENKNLTDVHPEKTKAMTQKVSTWYKSMPGYALKIN